MRDALAIEVLKEERARRKRRRTVAAWAEHGPAADLGPVRFYGWQRDAVAVLEAELRAVVAARDSGEARRPVVVLTSAPQQVGKSQLVRHTASWVMAELGLSVGVVSYNDELATEHGSAMRRLVASDEARDLWPWLARKLPNTEGASTSVTRWSVPARVESLPPVRCRIAGRRGGLEGQMLDLFVLDDLVKSPSDAESPATHRMLDDLLRTSVLARVMTRGGVVWDVGTRRGARDSKGWLLQAARDIAGSGAELRVIDQRYPVRGPESWRLPGGYVAPGWDAAKEAVARRAYGRYHRVLLDCEDIEAAGGLLSLEHFAATYTDAPEAVARACGATYLVADCAQTADGGDHTVIQWWGVAHGRLYLLHQWRGQWDDAGVVEALRSAVAHVRQARGVLAGVLVEDTSAGRTALYALQRAITPAPTPVRPVGAKRDRIMGARLVLSQGQVLIPAFAPWLDERDANGMDWRDRMLALRGERADMRGEVDDEADAMAIMISHWLSGMPSAVEVLARW